MIKVHALGKRYCDTQAVRNVHIQFEPGNFYALLGKNGAGKSTLMRLLMRFEEPSSGEGQILGRRLIDDDPTLNQEVGYVSEGLEFNLPIKISSIAEHYQSLYPKWSPSLFEKISNELRIDTDKKFKDLSRGQKMQVAFAFAASIQPKVFLLDEITAVLDAEARSFVIEYLKRFVAEGGLVVLTTNLVSEVHTAADRMILMHHGEVKVDLPVEEIPNQYVKIRKQEHQEDHEIFRRRECRQVHVNSDGSLSFIIPSDSLKTEEVPAEFIDRRNITLQELFIYLTQKEGEFE